MRKVAVALAALALTTLSIVALAPPTRSWAAPYVPQASNRAVLNFNTHWLFAGEVPGGNGQAVQDDRDVPAGGLDQQIAAAEDLVGRRRSGRPAPR